MKTSKLARRQRPGSDIPCRLRQEAPAPAASTNTASSASSPLTAPVTTSAPCAKGQQLAVKTVDTASLDRASKCSVWSRGAFQRPERVGPGKVHAEAPEPPYGMKLVYDPNTGIVKVVKQ